MKDFARDVRIALRKLFRTPLFTVTALVTLAVGIGANTAIFSVVNAVLLKPLPFEDPEGLVALWHEAPGLDFPVLNQSPATYLTYRSDSELLEDIAIWDNTAVQVTGGDQPEELPALLVTDAFFPLLGVQAAVGRVIGPADDAPTAPRTAMISHDYWGRGFSSDPEVVGRTVSINGNPVEIIGVLPEGFRFLRFNPDVVVPARFDPAQVMMGQFSYQAFGRLRPGVTLQQLELELERLMPVAVERYPGPVTMTMLEQARFGALVWSLKEDLVGDVRTVLWVLLGTVAMVLLIASANVANLFLVRAEGRVRQVALQTALGADRGTVARLFLSESVLLGLMGGVLGTGLAAAGLRLLLRLAPGQLPRLDEVGLDGTVLGFTLAISILSGLLFGLIPLLRYGRPDLVSTLKEGGRGGGQGKERHRARNTLVVAQVALALVLLMGSGLMIRSFQALRQVDPGFTDPAELMSFRVYIPGTVMDDPVEVAAGHEQILRNLEAIPGIVSAGGSSSITMDGYDSNDPLWAEGLAVPEGQLPPIRRYKWILPGYFGTMGNPLVAGRDLSWDDVHSRRPVTLVTENLARELWQEPSRAIGKRVSTLTLEGTAGVWREVIGVVGDVHDDGLSEDPVATVYWPQIMTDFQGDSLFAMRSMSYVVRAGPGVMPTLLPRIQEAVWSVSSSLPLASITTQQERLEESLARTSFILVLLGIAAGVALLLGSVGIYGVISYAVSQRTREIGVRMALGAEQGRVTGMMLREGLVLAAVGIAVGAGAALALTRLMSSLLYGVNPVDLPTFTAVGATLAAVAALASWLPARRAAAVDPAVTLREE
ncbi:MAG TPA: ABC transporter permease [Longimicrobiales bacterium]|nr:ABC transporter permease [Longimicrobiales bacterium]